MEGRKDSEGRIPKEERKEERKEGKEGMDGWMDGGREGRKEGRKEARKEGREGWTPKGAVASPRLQDRSGSEQHWRCHWR